MNMMLSKNPLSRLCKISHIKSHPWLQTFSWDSLISLDLQPPYVPKLKSKDEDSNLRPYVNYIKVYIRFKLDYINLYNNLNNYIKLFLESKRVSCN